LGLARQPPPRRAAGFPPIRPRFVPLIPLQAELSVAW
jgi:hypothetical protein